MDKHVRRVTVVQGSGENRQANVVYKSTEDEEEEKYGIPFSKLERSVRHYLKAQVVAAQEAYKMHVEAVEKGGNSWIIEDPFNMMRARRKAMKEMRKAPFTMMFGADAEKDEDEEGE